MARGPSWDQLKATMSTASSATTRGHLLSDDPDPALDARRWGVAGAEPLPQSWRSRIGRSSTRHRLAA